MSWILPLLVIHCVGSTLPAPADGVRDPVLGCLVSLLAEEQFGVYKTHQFESLLQGRPQTSRVPLEVLRDISRAPYSGHRSAPPQATLQIRFTGEREVPIPYSILGYHPGKLRTSGTVRFLEWHMGDITIRPAGQPPVALKNVVLWGMEHGVMDMDIDGWLDAILGEKLDDTQIVGLALFEHRGELVAMAMGYNKNGRGASGAFSLRQDQILFPHPREYRIAGSYLRGRLELLLPEVRLRVNVR